MADNRRYPQPPPRPSRHRLPHAGLHGRGGGCRPGDLPALAPPGPGAAAFRDPRTAGLADHHADPALHRSPARRQGAARDLCWHVAARAGGAGAGCRAARSPGAGRDFVHGPADAAGAPSRRTSAPPSCCTKSSRPITRTSPASSARPSPPAASWCTARRIGSRKASRASPRPAPSRKRSWRASSAPSPAAMSRGWPPCSARTRRCFPTAAARRAATLNPIYGAEKIARFFIGVRDKQPEGARMEPRLVNGSLGYVVYVGDKPLQANHFEFDGDRIVAVHIVRNPRQAAASDAGVASSVRPDRPHAASRPSSCPSPDGRRYGCCSSLRELPLP